MNNLDDWFIQNSWNKRCNDSQKIMKNYPDRYPIIVFPASAYTPKISKHKYLVSRDTTMGMFLTMIRSMVKLKQQEAIFMFIITFDNGVKEHLASSHKTFAQLYDQYKHEDGFMYIKYDIENTFGFKEMQ